MANRNVLKSAALCMAVTMALPAGIAAENAAGRTEAKVERKTVEHLQNIEAETTDRGEASIYFVEGGDIPYAALSEYAPLLGGIVKKAAGTEISFEVKKLEEAHMYEVARTDRKSSMIVNTEKDTLYFDNFNTFLLDARLTGSVTVMDLTDPQEPDLTGYYSQMENAGSADAMLEMLTDLAGKGFAAEKDQLFTATADAFNRAGNVLLLDLSPYQIDFVEQGGECYVPLQTLNDMFLWQMYIRSVYNGKALYTFGDDCPLQEQVYEAEGEEMSEAFAMFNYNELRFMLDCFYGLKQEHSVEDFGHLLSMDTDLVKDLTSTDPAKFDRAVSILTAKYMDDGHSAFIKGSWRSGKADVSDMISQMADDGPSNTTRAELMKEFKAARKKAYPEKVPMYQEVGNTAFVTFDTFVAEKAPSEYYSLKLDPQEFYLQHPKEMDEKEALTALFSGQGLEDEEPKEADTIALVMYAHSQITRQGSPIRNVVVDLSNNGGGNANAAAFIISWLIGQADIALKDTFTGAETVMHIAADVNRDNKYDAKTDSLYAQGYRLFVLTSPSSFSCGNLVPAACKASDRVTLVGRTSGGGACVVQACTSASGTLFQISSPKQLAAVRNGSFYNIDAGIEPDVTLTRVESFYDRQGLVDMLNGLK